MKSVLSALLGIVMVFALVTGISAADKEETLKGRITCAKCTLKLEGQKSCAIVLVVKKGDKETIYWFDPASHKKYHGDFCKEDKEGTVTGTVTEKDKKKFIKVDKLETK
jgi:hypothetical protein